MPRVATTDRSSAAATSRSGTILLLPEGSRRFESAPVVVATCGTLLAIVVPLTGRWQLSVIAFVLASVTTLWAVHAAHRVEPRALVAAIGAVFAVAVALAPTGSHDLWSYAMVGRTVAVHHANPYVTPPRAFASDPYLRRVGPGWRRTTTPYGPLFVAYAATVARIAGPHPLFARLGFQLGAAGAVGCSLWLVWRATGAARAVVLLALQPVVAVSIINGGHNDAFVGLAVLGAVVLAREERHVASGTLLALGALVKLPAGLAFLPLTAWVWRRRGTRAAAATVAPAIVPLLVSLVVPGAMGSVVAADAGIVSRASVWNVVMQLHHVYDPTWGGSRFSSVVTKFGLFAVIAVACGAAWHAARVRTQLDRGIVLATGSWMFVGAYALPWYAGWSLPVAALQPESALTTVVAAQAAFVGACELIPRGVLSEHVAFAMLVRDLLPLLGLAAFAFAAVSHRARDDMSASGGISRAGSAGRAGSARLDRAR
jgi:hypothetical protein